ncbi:ATP-binding protein [Aliivibrio sifiae]|uniref:histidine kinase n=1 Tax=Aliivibrio sifiae TaxID=566293 RepID=A0A2S7X6Q8_9GAMM|nr:ATP-binding protein [Aliivibrio sifiae]PQJ86846.1 hybrid sensor histidine kinase/response regulator [Aliivibrio sifiae]GLR74035.1 hybrid sensor histidine kinase/response regulator [Aliivibrio sifiae]
MDNDKMVELLNRKMQREKAARKAAEMLLEQKSRELFMAKQLVEETLLVVQEKAEKDVALLQLKGYLDVILLDYNQAFLKAEPSSILLQRLLDDLASIDGISALCLTVFPEFNLHGHLQSVLIAGEYSQCDDELAHSSAEFNWSQNGAHIIVYLHHKNERCGSLQFTFNNPPSKTWHQTIEKQCRLFSEMLSAAFIRQQLLEKTMIEKQRAENSEQSTRDFVAMINHELRTPLNGLLGSAELMEDTEITSYQQTLLTTIHQSGEMLRVIINDLLDFSKMNAGMLKLTSIQFEPAILIQTIKHIFAHQIEEKRLSFVVDIENTLPVELWGDVDRIQQILVNLIGNAIKFTKEGEIRFSISWHENALRFIVSDSGCGIPLEKQATLFDPFTQVDNSSQRQFEGTGLGLSICKSLVDKMEGELTLKSELGKGAVFTAIIPLIVASEKKLELKECTDCTHSIDGLSVLAVEDIKMNQVILNMMLAKVNIQPDFANDGQEALGFLDQKEVEIILMDCRMPIMDGFETTRKLREQGYSKPIIALTAGTTSTEVDSCMSAGMDDILHKPYKAKELEKMLMKWSCSSFSGNKNT